MSDQPRMSSADFLSGLSGDKPKTAVDLTSPVSTTRTPLLHQHAKRRRIDREGPIQAGAHDLMVRFAPLDCVYLSIPNEQTGGKGRGGRLNALGRMPGAADYWIIYRGVVTFIEFKCLKDAHGPKTYLKPEQKAFRDTVTAMPNTRYAVCRSVDEFALVVKAAGLLPQYRIQGPLAQIATYGGVAIDAYRLEALQS